MDGLPNFLPQKVDKFFIIENLRICNIKSLAKKISIENV